VSDNAGVSRKLNSKWVGLALLICGTAFAFLGSFVHGRHRASTLPPPFRPQISPRISATTNGNHPSAQTPTTEKPPAPKNWQLPPLDAYISTLVGTHGNKFTVKEGESVPILQHLIDQIPKSQFVDLLPFYETIQGLDNTTKDEGLEKVRRNYVGKYYMLQGDVFKIQADRDYPREGLNEFEMFGEVRLVGSHYVPVNIECFSYEKVPPYASAPVLGKIIGFYMDRNQRGDNIIVPVVRVIAVVVPANCCDYPEDVIINPL
jgi:hypothetical protein